MRKIKIILLLLLFIPTSVLAYSTNIIVGGDNVGINVKSDGVLVVGFYKINGEYIDSAINIGDYIVKANDVDINNTSDLINIIKSTNKNYIDLVVRRNNKEKNIQIPIIKDNNEFKTGLYIKNEISGIGTLTYIDPETSIFGALGHEIIDNSTNQILEITDGTIFESSVTSIEKSRNGIPGTKNARLNPAKKLGNIDKNNNKGIYGEYNGIINNEKRIDIGYPEDLKTGDATIRTVLNNKEVKEYKINITKIDLKNETKNIFFEITDEYLLNNTGGIVQGMSGSPIIQNNHIFGAVTHVVVDNVKKGYGIFITTMLEEGEKDY